MCDNLANELVAAWEAGQCFDVARADEEAFASDGADEFNRWVELSKAIQYLSRCDFVFAVEGVEEHAGELRNVCVLERVIGLDGLDD